MQKDQQVIHKLKCISMVSLLFMTVQIAGGIMANSIAILADAFHLLSDVLAYIISLQAVLMSHKLPPFFMTFGYEKVQPLGALINIAIIWFVTVQLVIEATQRIVNKAVVSDPLFMLLTSVFGLGCNLYIMRVLHSDTEHGGHQGCSHSHGLEHHHGIKGHQGHSHQHDHDHNGHGHQHKHGEKCSHGHSNNKTKAIVKKQSKKKCSHGHGNHNHHEHEHGHSHDSQHQHQHNHQHQHQQKVEEKHEHKHGPKCSHHHSDEHKHEHKHKQDHHEHQEEHDHHQHDHQHQHDHEHDHDHDHDHDHKHQNRTLKDSCDSFRQLNAYQPQNSSTQLSQTATLMQTNPVYEQIALNQHISYKPDTSQLNLSDQNLRIIQKQKSRKQLFNNINIQAAYIHILSDIILSIGVIISASIIYFKADPQQWTYWQLADPCCTYLFSIMAIYSTVGIAKDSVIILLDGCDDRNMLKQIIQELDNMGEIDQYRELRVWSLNRAKFAAAVKIYLSKEKYQNARQREDVRKRVIGLFSGREISHYVQVCEESEKLMKYQ